MSRQVIAAAALALLLAGCASYGTGNLQTGLTADEVAARMGPPTGRYTLPDGSTRLEYARGPLGKHTYMVDLDAQGRVEKRSGGRQGGEVWSYRYDA